MPPAAPDSHHARCVPKACTVLAGLVGHAGDDSRRALRIEQALTQRLNDWGIDCQHQPRGGFFADEGTEIEPDIGLRDPRSTAGSFRSRGEVLNVLVEVKVQDRTGTADQKIEAALERYARLADDNGTLTVLVAGLCPSAVPAARTADLRRIAQRSLVGFLTVEDFTAQRLWDEIALVRSRREQLAAAQTAAALAERFDPYVLAAAARLCERGTGVSR